MQINKIINPNTGIETIIYELGNSHEVAFSPKLLWLKCITPLDREIVSRIVEHCRSNEENMSLNFYAGEFQHIEFLEPFIHKFTALSIGSQNIDWAMLSRFTKICKLSIDGYFKTKLDLSKMCELERMDACFNDGYNDSYKNLQKLKEIKFNNFNYENLSVFKDLPSLEILDLVDARKLTDLSHLKVLKKPFQLELLAASSLEDLSGLADSKVEILKIESCKKIKNWEALADAKYLKKLYILTSSAIPSLDFLANSQLQIFQIANTKLLDGNLKQLENIPTLHKVYGKNQRGFNIKIEELNKILANRQLA